MKHGQMQRMVIDYDANGAVSSVNMLTNRAGTTTFDDGGMEQTTQQKNMSLSGGGLSENSRELLQSLTESLMTDEVDQLKRQAEEKQQAAEQRLEEAQKAAAVAREAEERAADDI